MSRASRPWNDVGPLMLASLLLFGAVASASEPPPLAQQLTELGRQALEQGQAAQARSFFRKALELDPANAAARQGEARIRRVAFQDPAAPPAAEPPGAPVAEPPAAEPIPGAPPAAAPGTEPNVAPPAEGKPRATLEEAEHLQEVVRQQLVADIRQRLQTARDLVNAGQPEDALQTLRLAQSVARSAEDVSEAVRNDLDRQIQTQILSTVRAEERIVQERAERLRREAAAEQQTRALDLLERSQETVSTMMVQFDSLMAQGQYNVLYNGGSGDIVATTAPFGEARLLAQKARALVPNDPAPRVGMFTAQTMGFLAQGIAYNQIKYFRAMLSFQDVDRAGVPFPDTITIEYPDAELWKNLSERRIRRYGKAVDLLDRDPDRKSVV